MSVRILTGDCRDVLKTLPDESVHCVVTSPPYFGLRDYGVDGQMGLEKSPDEFVAGMVEVFREVRRVLRDDGTLWLNIGDSYANDGKWGGHTGGKHVKALHCSPIGRNKRYTGLKPKDLVGIPWMLAFALRADGWYLRQDIIWAKPNPMPESVRDRCTKAHEYLFLLTKSERYFYDGDAVKEPASSADEYAYAGDQNGLHSGESHAGSGKSTRRFAKGVAGWAAGGSKSAIQHNAAGRVTHADVVKAATRERHEQHDELGNVVTPAVSKRMGRGPGWREDPNNYVLTRNKRSVWTVPTKPFKEAHFATFPPALIEPCIKAGTSIAGCCASCGAPIVRQTDREFMAQPDVSKENGVRGAADQKPMDATNGWQDTPRGTSSSRTTGWLPSCDCIDSRSVPCTVLDPFGGAGTTGLVADRLQRSAILIELNPEYAAMAARRINGDGKLFAAAQVEAPQAAIA